MSGIDGSYGSSAVECLMAEDMNPSSPARPPCCSTSCPALPPVPGLPLSMEVMLHGFRREMCGVLLQPVSGGDGAAGGEGA
jgi:hypothetical protein